MKKASNEFYLPFSACTLKIVDASLDFKNKIETFKIKYTVCLKNPYAAQF